MLRLCPPEMAYPLYWKGTQAALRQERVRLQSRRWEVRCGEPMSCAHVGCTYESASPKVTFFSSSISVVRGCIIFMSNGNVWFHVLTRLHNFRTESLIFSQKRKTLERWRGEKNTRTETSSYFLFKFNTYGLWRTLWLFSLDLEGRYKWTVVNSSNAFAH